MVEYYIDNNLTKYLKQCDRFSQLSNEEHEQLYMEVCNASLQEIGDELISQAKKNVARENKSNSVLLWALGICDDKPNGSLKIKSAGSLPDIDSDFSKLNRGKVIDYIKSKYGEDRVTQVVTFGKLAAKAAIRAAQRALYYSVADGDYLAKHIPNEPDITLQIAIDNSDLLKDVIAKQQDPYYHILTTAIKLEGLPNASGVHASALCVSDIPTYEYLPLMVSKKDGEAVLTQYEYKDVEANFLCKFDILGLKTLDIIKGCIDLVKKRHKVDIKLEDIDVNDPSIYKLLNDGHNCLIFQFESSIFKAAVNKVNPQNVDDLSAITSLLRPGPMQNGMLDAYIEAKVNGKLYTYDLKDKKLIAKVQDICKECHSIMAYQEYVIRCFAEIGGMDETQSDDARRGLGKKKLDVLEALGKEFVKGGLANGYIEEDLNKLFKQIELFAGYSFNASHAYSYSYITCYTAYLSANYPIEFYASALTVDADNTDDIRKYIYGAKLRGITILPPRINTSGVGFVISDDNVVFGLNAIKGVGKALSNKILKNRPKLGYSSLGHFMSRNIDLLNKKVLEGYIKAGVFHDFKYTKNALLDSVDDLLDITSTLKGSDVHTIFDIFNINVDSFIDNNLVSKRLFLKDDPYYEVESTGLYITQHPLDDYIVNKKYSSPTKLSNCGLIDGDELRVKIVGAISGIAVRKTKARANMAEFMLTDTENAVNIIVFPAVYAKCIDSIVEGRTVMITGIAKYDNGNLIVQTRDVELYNGSQEWLMKKLYKGPLTPAKKIINHVVNNSLSFMLKEK